jgi:parkin
MLQINFYSDTLQECDLGQQSVLHAVKSHPSHKKSGLESPSVGSKPLNETLMDLQLSDLERHNLRTDEGD